jgi:hypothetical protein
LGKGKEAHEHEGKEEKKMSCVAEQHGADKRTVEVVML